MTVSITTSSIGYDCDGVADSFIYPFRILQEADLDVILINSVGLESELILDIDYTVTGAGNVNGGTVVPTNPAAWETGMTLVLERNTELIQDTDFVDGEGFSAESIEECIDKTMLSLQDTRRRLAVIEAGQTPVGTTASYEYFLSDYLDLTDALTQIGSIATVLVVNENAAVNADMTVPSTLSLKVPKGNVITIASGKTLTINGVLESGDYQIFSGAGSVSISSGAPVYPEWWGAVPDGVTDCSPAINKAVNSSNHVKFGDGTYLMEPYTTVSTSEYGLILTSSHNNLQLSGNGRSSIIKLKSSAVGQNMFGIVMTSAKGVRIENLSFDGDADSQWNSNPATSVNGFMIIRFVPDSDNAVDDIGITNCYFRGSFDSAITSYGNSTAAYPVGQTHHYYTSRVKITNCTFEDTGAHGVGMNEWVDSIVTGCTFTNVGRKPVISDIGSGMAVDVSAGCDHVIVSNNTVRSPYAIAGFKTETHYVSGSDYNYAMNVIIEKNTINVGKDYQFAYAIKASGKNITVRGNIIEQGYVHGINIARTTGGASPSVTENIIVEGNIIRDIKDATSPSAGSSYGIRADGGINVSILNNQVFGTYPLSGIFASSDNVTISGNSISNDYATGSGIRTAGTNIVVSSNTVKNTYIGINCGSSQSTVTGNVIYDDRTDASRVMIYGIFFAETVNMVRESDNVVLNAITLKYKYPSETAAAANEVSTTSNGFKSVFTGSPGGFYGTFTNGDVVYLNVVAAGGAHSYRCTTSGTILAGTYAITAGQVMGTITAGLKLLTVSGSEIAKLKPGHYITIPGAGAAAADLKTRIDSIDSAGTTVTIVDAASTTVSTPAQIAHTPFVIKSFGNLAP